MAKQDLLRVLTEASRQGNTSAIFAVMAELKGLDVPTSEVMAAFTLGRTRASLGL